MQTEAQKRAVEKWQKENMTTVGVRMKKAEAEEFRIYAERNGTTRNAILLKCAREYIQQNKE